MEVGNVRQKRRLTAGYAVNMGQVLEQTRNICLLMFILLAATTLEASRDNCEEGFNKDIFLVGVVVIFSKG